MASWCTRTQRKINMLPDGQLVHEDPEEDEDDPNQDRKDRETSHEVVRLPEKEVCTF